MTLRRDQVIARRDRLAAEAQRRGITLQQLVLLRLARLEIVLEGISRDAPEDPSAALEEEQ